MSSQILYPHKRLFKVVHPFYTPAHPFRHTPIPMRVLRETLPSEERHEEAHLHPYSLSHVMYVDEHFKEKWIEGGTGKHIILVSSRISTVSH
ncbi:unnamed protein product [Strongylus vulgaris]|uniref:Uncharacterized protein n=1 Tax=Strongylus vulgaris TaxID=40348 RepID=A0A3P7JHL6_STRVU|nr:unnamed protein product [Strongylus vulgaris]